MVHSEEHLNGRTSALEIGHPEIDADHRAMVSLLNRLQAASSRSDEAEVRIDAQRHSKR